MLASLLAWESLLAIACERLESLVAIRFLLRALPLDLLSSDEVNYHMWLLLQCAAGGWRSLLARKEALATLAIAASQQEEATARSDRRNKKRRKKKHHDDGGRNHTQPSEKRSQTVANDASSLSCLRNSFTDPKCFREKQGQTKYSVLQDEDNKNKIEKKKGDKVFLQV